MMFYVMAFGWSFTSLLFLANQNVAEIAELTLDGWTGVAFLGIFCSGLAHIARYDALQALSTALFTLVLLVAYREWLSIRLDA